MRILRLIEHPDEPVAGTGDLALGHIGFDGVSDQVLRSSLDRPSPTRSRAVMYALGMTGSPGLVGMMRSASYTRLAECRRGLVGRQGPPSVHGLREHAHVSDVRLELAGNNWGYKRWSSSGKRVPWGSWHILDEATATRSSAST